MPVLLSSAVVLRSLTLLFCSLLPLFVAAVCQRSLLPLATAAGTVGRGSLPLFCYFLRLLC